MEQHLLFADEKVLKLQEVESGFDVLNIDDFKGKDVRRLGHSPNKKTNEHIGVSKEEFEAEVKKCYGVNNVIWVNKLENEQGEFILNKVLIKYKFTAEIGHSPSHLEFNSNSGSVPTNDYVKVPNLISETGYRSEFFGLGEKLEYPSVKALIERYCLDKCKIKPEFNTISQTETPKKVESPLFDFDIMREDLREWIFKEDDTSRYRERIQDKIKEFGIEKWFKAKGYPTDDKSVWKNRYTGDLTTLGEEIHNEVNKPSNSDNFEYQAYYLWENWLPQALWNDKELSLSYKVGTQEYHDRIKEDEKNAKKYKTKVKTQKPLFAEEEDSEVELSDDELVDEEDSCLAEEEMDYDDMTIPQKQEAHNKRLLTKKAEIVNKENNTIQEQQVYDFSREVESSDLNIDLRGTIFEEQDLYTSSSLTKPRNELGSWSGGGTTLKGTNEEIMDYILNFLKDNLKKPYSDKETPFTTTLKIENCHINIEKSAIDFLTKRGFDFKKLDTEERLLKSSQKIATQEDLMKAKTFELMEKSMEKLRDETWAIRGYFENFLNRRKQNEKNPYYLSQMTKYGIDYSNLDKLKELYESKANIYHIYYKKVYEMRWNTPCDEEYSYV